MATYKRKKQSILKKIAVNESDEASVSETSVLDSKDRSNPKQIKTAQDEAANIITKIASFDRKAKSILHAVYEDIQDILKSKHFFPEIKTEMTAEFGDISRVIQQNQSDVYDELCPIVVTGETSAGKSTFINLLLGVELLPQSPLTCTSPICRISNRDHKKIVLTDNDNKQETVIVPKHQISEDMKNLLKDYICATKAGEKYKAVDICWPIPCLQNKIMIVDTPGISPDNEILTQRLFDYLPSALAFIYIINPTNAGGVQSDRLNRILNEQERRRFMGMRSVFDPRRAIFVCNKWDQMHEDEDQVFNHIKQKLTEKWINFNSSQLFKISAWEELQTSKSGGPISDNFKALLQAIDKMVPVCLEEKIFRHAHWQKYFLERLNFKLEARVANALRSEDDKRMMTQQVLKRIQKVRDDLKSVQSHLKNRAKKQCQWTAEILQNHLHLPETRDKMFLNIKHELPEDGDIGEIQDLVTTIVEHEIIQQIKFWLIKTNNGGLSEFIMEQFRQKCSIVESDCIEIDQLILGRNFTTENIMVTTAQQPNYLSNITRTEKVTLLATLPLWLPFAFVGALFVLPVGITYFVRARFRNYKNNKEYKRNKLSFAQNILDKLLSDVDECFLKEKVFNLFLKEINEQIDQFCESTVPQRITAAEIFVKSLQKTILHPIEIRKQCLLLGREFKSTIGCVLFIHMEYFIKERCQVRQSNTSNVFEIVVNGYWVETKMKQIRWSYDKRVDCEKLCNIQILRSIKHANILSVLELMLQSNQRGIFLNIYTEKCDKGLDTIIFHSSKQEEPWASLKTYLCHSLQGLRYLHERGFIHGNIHPTNILIKDGVAKLSDVAIDSPIVEDSTDGLPTKEFMNTLLNGREEDNLHFGIVLWESWYRRSASDEIGESSLKTYKQISQIILEGESLDFDGKISPKLKAVIIDCWQKNPTDRPSARNLLERLQSCK